MADGYPGPFKCPDCGSWWVGMEHRCSVYRWDQPTHGPEERCAWPLCPICRAQTNSFTVTCTCIWRKWERVPTPGCPVHDVRVTYTSHTSARPNWRTSVE